MVKEKINFGEELPHKKLLRSDVMEVHTFAAELKISKIPVIVRRCFQWSLAIANNKKTFATTLIKHVAVMKFETTLQCNSYFFGNYLLNHKQNPVTVKYC